MDPPRLNIDDLYETKQRIDLNRIDLYNKLLLKIHNNIKIASRQRNQLNFCTYVMPEILVGYPNYNLSECLNYIIDKLQHDCFICKYIHPNLLMISWNHWIPKYVREQIKKKTGVIVDCYGNPMNDGVDLNTTTINKPPDKIKSNIYADKLIDSMKNLLK